MQHLIHAGKRFQAALQLQSDNIYAANGLGAVAAEMDEMAAAQQIFADLREAAATASGFVRLPDVRHPLAPFGAYCVQLGNDIQGAAAMLLQLRRCLFICRIVD